MLKLDFENVKKMVAFKKAGFWEREVWVLLMLQASTIAASQQAHLLGFALRRILLLGQQNCLDVWEAHHLEQWSLLGAACSTLRRFGWPTASVGEWFSFCYCLWRRFLPTPRFQQSSTPTQLQGRLGHQLQLAQRSFLADASVDSSNGELQTSSAWSCLWGFSSNFAALWFSSFARHCLLVWSSLSIVFWLDDMLDFRTLFAS